MKFKTDVVHKKTPLYEFHMAKKAEMVEFAGFLMPLHYGSQLQEHLQVRNILGMFDVSHMGIIDITGKSVRQFLRYLLANDIAKLKHEKLALYSCMLNEQGGIIDDLIVYYINDQHFRLVVNAATQEKDLVWIQKQAEQFSNLQINRMDSHTIIALQGRDAKTTLAKIYPHLKEKIMALKPFEFLFLNESESYPLIAYTGYTGEVGLEIISDQTTGITLWQTLLDLKVSPIGLAARDSLRVEAGLNLYGEDMDEQVTPFESNLSWTVSLDTERNFIGKQALLADQKKGIAKKLIGLILLDKGILRAHQTVYQGAQEIGWVTSGSYSPLLKHSIGFARIAAEINLEEQDLSVLIRNKHLKAQAVMPPFVRRNK